jgi:metallo-beta-lactamase family protein
MAATVGFYGGVGSVTGANFMLDTGSLAILVDCGMVQGDKFAKDINRKPFVYDPSTVDILLVTHALHIMEMEAKRDDVPPMYSGDDIDQALAMWKDKAYYEAFTLGDGITAEFTNAGHILGSAMVHLTRNGKKFVFTGDIGNVPQPLLAKPDVPENYDYLLMESVYGDRVHEEVEERTAILQHHIEDTITKQGTLIIPAFSLERTQGMLFEINNLVEAGKIPPIKTFLDSPLAIRVTDVYRHSLEYLKPDVQEQIKQGDDIFEFEGLSFTETMKESSQIARFTKQLAAWVG